MLFPMTEAEAGLRLWSVAAGGAIAAGLNASELPKLENMFKHVSQTLGGELEGFPSLSEHRPQAPARELLQQFWPLALMCFNGELSGAVAKSGAVSQRWRPIIRCLCREYVHTQGPVRPWSGSRDRYRHGDRDLQVKTRSGRYRKTVARRGHRAAMNDNPR
jgi:hypothetical protein